MTPVTPDLSSSLQTAIELLRNARRTVVFSGAGLSRASGIPTYRDADGLWKSQNALQFSHAEDLARDPSGFTRFWAQRLSVIESALPNPGHAALAQLQRLRPATRLVTQNVDGLLTQAGGQDVLELHGSLRRWRCDHCGNRSGPWPFHRCLRCGSHARPDVVMFGEMLNAGVLLDAQVAAQECDLFMVVGSTTIVYPAAELPQTALAHGARLVTLNVEPLPHLDDAASAVLRGTSEELLPKLLAGLG
ncbi:MULTISPECIES: Sir2 family NAD-dependent protein deacetylase [unclassified Variovorax]|uniref:SIR2 family NAD-dependent protein deacylase n=1 Tax=unclassified Variovorax TaxID=663243 RepID=UPI0008C79020|nr:MULTISPECIES: Sir2 family NAD-dependent protein deacetylase [unclassified Variovorax]SEJ87732.1 NAD-dependent deacetylase [Variovorax sp. OK202]SFD03785.1 NAD-dependent deacetylase [Variovorax sp. OK212]